MKSILYVKYTGKHNLKKRIHTRLREVVKGVDTAALLTAYEVLNRSNKLVPVDTGYLKSSGRVVQVVRGFIVTYDAYYAIYVHEREDVIHKVGESHFLSKAYKSVMADLRAGRNYYIV